MHDPDETDPAARVPPALAVPRPVRVAAEWSWRLLVIASAVVAAALLANRLKLLLLALFVALLVTALLAPVVHRAQRVTWGRRGFATLVVLVLCIALLVGVVSLLAVEVSSQVNALSDTFTDGLDQIRSWLRDTFGVDDARIQQWVQQVVDQIRANRESILS